MKEKYADQDEDEREMKLALLGSKKPVQGFDIDAHSRFVQGSMYKPKPKEDESESSSEDEAEMEEQKEIEEEKPAEEPKVDEDEDDLEEEKDQDDEADEAEIQKLMKEEDINMLPEAMDLAEIDKLTGVPKSKGKLLPANLVFRLIKMSNQQTIEKHHCCF